MRYRTIASTAGPGPMEVQGNWLPLAPSALLRRMLHGWTAPNMIAAGGFLDAQGDASVTLHPAPFMAPLLGARLHLATVAFDLQAAQPIPQGLDVDHPRRRPLARELRTSS